jgi:hypothetical protein
MDKRNHWYHSKGHDVYIYISREDKAGRRGILISIHEVIQQLSCLEIDHWRFHEMTMGAGAPFGIGSLRFEEETRISPRGFLATNTQFNEFLKSDIQVIDGCIEGFMKEDNKQPLIRLDCNDASEWVVTTKDERVAKRLQEIGWVRG